MQSTKENFANVDTLGNVGEHTISPQTYSTKFITKQLIQKTVKSKSNRLGEDNENIQANRASSLTSKYLKVNTLPIVTIMICVLFVIIAYLYVLSRILTRKNKHRFNCYKICCFYMK